MTTIYLSSTYQDLKAYRTAVFDALRQSGYEVIAMEDYVARDDRPLKACLDDVERADIYVGLFAFRYGCIPPSEHDNPEGLSITELEFRCAEASPTTRCLVFLIDEKAPWSSGFNDAWTGDGGKGERIRRLRDELSREKIGGFFSAPYELASKVQSAVKLCTDSKRATTEQPAEQDAKITWDVAKEGSPYPGLMHFTRRFAPVFFGREVEIRELLDRSGLPEGRFVIVSGDSGSGKSSLVDAGVLPRLEKQSLRSVRMVPSGGEDPFDALLRALRPFIERVGIDDYQLGRDLAAGRTELVYVLRDILTHGFEGAGLILFLDQMEELFITPDKKGALTSRFLSGLYAATQTLQFQVLATIRSDLLHHCYEQPEMLAVLKSLGHYPLGRAAPHMLYDMIAQPAQCAGVSVPETLVRRLIEDVGAEPGNLPLLAFVLQRLFAQKKDDVLSEAAYDTMGGLTGAIAEHLQEVERQFAKNQQLSREGLESLFTSLFEALVQVDAEGLPTRRRVYLADLPELLAPVVEVLIKTRLLVAEGEGAESTISVAHERLFVAWPTLARWVAEHQDDLRLLRQGELDAAEWHRHSRNLAYLWHTDRLKRLQAVIESLSMGHGSERLRTFAWPQQSLIHLLEDPSLEHDARDTIGHYLSNLGDPRQGVGVQKDGTPDVEWVAVPGGDVELGYSTDKVRVAPFHMSRYLVTNAQFRAFIDAVDGYTRVDEWVRLPPNIFVGPAKTRWSQSNGPRDSVSWYEAMAFCRWLSQRYGFEVLLPTEYQWQQAATGGDTKNHYPWGSEWDARRCNTSESALNRTTSVGLYPAGANIQGILDLSGNLWEWCLNKYDNPNDTIDDNSWESRAIRGGSWGNNSGDVRTQERAYSNPVPWRASHGFRLVCVSPIR